MDPVALIVIVTAGIAGLLAWQLNHGKTPAEPPRFGPDTPVFKFRSEGTFDVEVVGESHYQEAIAAAVGGPTPSGVDLVVEALLYLDDYNEHDKNAVRVLLGGETVGHLSRPYARRLRARLAEEGATKHILMVTARVRGGWDRGDGDAGPFGIRLDIPPLS